MRRFTGHPEEWGEFVDVRANAPEILKRQLRRRKKGTVLLGSVTDCYQPLEKKYGLTRSILAVLADSELSVSILTKSDLVLRDLKLLATLPDVEIGLSITSLNDAASARFEPRATKVTKRIEALEMLKKAGLCTYAFIGPILPGITDPVAIIEKVAGSVDYIMAESLNTSCGNRAHIQQVLEASYSDESGRFWENARSSTYWASVEKSVRSACTRFGVRLAGFFGHSKRAKSSRASVRIGLDEDSDG
jgi:DNA repair photolyase